MRPPWWWPPRCWGSSSSRGQTPESRWVREVLGGWSHRGRVRGSLQHLEAGLLVVPCLTLQCKHIFEPTSCIPLPQVRERTAKGIIDVDYEVLNILEFNSTRKRQSVIVRDSSGRIFIFCKVGAIEGDSLSLITFIDSISPASPVILMPPPSSLGS